MREGRLGRRGCSCDLLHDVVMNAVYSVMLDTEPLAQEFRTFIKDVTCMKLGM